MEFLIDYGSFLLKTVSLIIIISIPFIILFSSKGKDVSPSGTLKITNLDELSAKSKVNIEIEQSTLITVESVEKIIAQKKV